MGQAGSRPRGTRWRVGHRDRDWRGQQVWCNSSVANRILSKEGASQRVKAVQVIKRQKGSTKHGFGIFIKRFLSKFIMC